MATVIERKQTAFRLIGWMEGWFPPSFLSLRLVTSIHGWHSAEALLTRGYRGTTPVGVEIRMLSNPMVALATLVYHRLSK